MNEAVRERDGVVLAYVELILGGMDEAEIGALWDELVEKRGEAFAGKVEAEVMRRDALLREQISSSARPSARGEPETTEAVPGAAQSSPAIADRLEEAIARGAEPGLSAIEREWRDRAKQEPDQPKAGALMLPYWSMPSEWPRKRPPPVDVTEY